MHTLPPGMGLKRYLLFSGDQPVSAADCLQVPPSLDFGFVPCKETASAQLPVRNTGDVRVGTGGQGVALGGPEGPPDHPLLRRAGLQTFGA